MADDMRTESRRLKGQRIELISCRDAYTRLEPGALGTITFVDDMGTVFVDWDDGHKLGLLPGVDSWRDVLMVMQRRPQEHPGRDCSPDCAEYGCAPWTACDGSHNYPETDGYGRRFRWVANYSAGVHEREYAPEEEDEV